MNETITAFVIYLSQMISTEAALFTSTFLFGEIAVISSAALAASGFVPITTVLIYTMLGSMTTDIFWFWAGPRLARRLRLESRLGVPASFKRKFSDMIDRNLFTAILSIKFLYGFRIFMLSYLGMKKVPFSLFFFLNLIGNLVFIGLLSAVGWSVGRGILHVFGIYSVIHTIFFAVAAAAALAFIFKQVFVSYVSNMPQIEPEKYGRYTVRELRKKERVQAERLMYKKYSEKGYLRPSDKPKKDFTPALVLGLLHDKEFVGTASVFIGTHRQLPLSETFADELGSYQEHDKVRVAEIGRLAVDSERLAEISPTQYRRAVPLLFRTIWHYVDTQKNISDILITVNPKHQVFYEHLCFIPSGYRNAYGAVNGAPAVLMKLDIADTNRRLSEKDPKVALLRSLLV